MKKRLFAVLLALLTLCSSLSVSASSGKAEENSTSADITEKVPLSATQKESDYGCKISGSGSLSLSADGAALMDAQTGEFLYTKNANEKFYPASITKIMTTLVALEHGNLSDPVTYNAKTLYAIEQDSSRVGIEANEILTLEDSLYCVMLVSGNDAAAGVAEHIGGTIDAFCDLMNQKAEELGCKNTHFTNPHGLHGENHYTTAADMALIMKAAMENEDFKRIASTVNHTVPATNLNKSRPLWNHHKMILPASEYHYEGVTGGKNGYTSIASNTLVTAAEKNGRSLISVVLHVPGAKYTYRDTKTLFNYGFDKFTTLKPLENFSLKTAAAESGISEEDLEKLDRLTVLYNGDYSVVAPVKVTAADITTSVTTETAEDGIWGSILFHYNNEEIGRANIYYDADEELNAILEEENTAISAVTAKVPFVLVGIMVFLIITIIYLLISLLIRR